MSNVAVLSPAKATPIVVYPAGTPLGYQQIVGLAAATALTVPPGATYALISPDAFPVRWRDDGTAPTATAGMQIAVGQMVSLANLGELQFIQNGGAATLNVSYYK